MSEFLASDIMRREVITVAPDLEVSTLARLLCDHGLSAVPVLDGDEIVGLVSEGDLLRRPETGTEEKAAWWFGLLADPAVLARRYVKTHGTLVRDVMTSPAVTVTEDTPLRAIADLFEARGIKQVPVTYHGRLAGMVSRRDLVRALAELCTTRSQACDDATIRTVLDTRLEDAPWADKTLLSPSVHDGIVEFDGWVKSPEERRAVQLVAETIPGVRAVHDHLLDLKVVSQAT